MLFHTKDKKPQRSLRRLLKNLQLLNTRYLN